MRNNLQHPVNCETGELNPPETAPDSAMRVAEQIYDNYGNSDWDKGRLV